MSLVRFAKFISPTLRQSQRGFSLLELLVTVVVMSILFGVAASLLRFDRGADVMGQKAQAFEYFYQAVADEAMLTGKLVRIVSKESATETRFIPQSKPQRDGKWTTVKGDFDALVVEKPLSVRLSVMPTVFPSGQSSSFTVTFSLDGRENVVLNVDGMGRITRREQGGTRE